MVWKSNENIKHNFKKRGKGGGRTNCQKEQAKDPKKPYQDFDNLIF